MSVLWVVLIVVVIAAIVGFVGFMIWLSNPTRLINSFEKDKEALLKNATPGDAKIIEVGASETHLGSMDVVLRLEVAPQFGESFNAITVWTIEPAHTAEIQAGKSIAVKIVEIQAGKSKTKKIKNIFPGVAWAELYNWPQECTEETMKTMVT
jgi:hypothetical protein